MEEKNNQRVSIESSVGFSDGEMVGYERIEDSLAVKIVAWNEKILKLKFEDAIAVRDYSCGEISDVCTYSGENEFFRKSLEFVYETIPQEHPYYLFQFINNDNQPQLEVVAARVEIEVE